MTYFLPCDIILTSDDTWLSKVIQFFERAPDEPKALVSHVGAIISGGPEAEAIIVEALSHVRRHRLWDEYGGRKTRVGAFRPLDLTRDQRARIIAGLESYVGRDYGYLKLVAHGLDWGLSKIFLRDVYLWRRLFCLDRYPICSWVVAQAWARAGLTFGVAPGQAQPDDIWDFCMSHPEKYELLRGLVPMET